jgi:hypothetical protein
MTSRKQTPDILAEILNGEAPAPDFPLPAPKTIKSPKPRQANPPASSAAEKHRPEKSSRAAPLSWDYHVVSFQDYKGFRPRFENGSEIRDWFKGPLLHEYLENKAAEGWELISASSGERLYGTSDRHQLFFRKPKTS